MPKQRTYPPEKPASTLSQIRENPDGVRVQVGRKNPGLFLLLWLIGWTVAGIHVIQTIAEDPAGSGLAFCLVVGVVWLAAAAFLIWLWRGRELIEIKPGEILFVREALITISTRAIPIDETLFFEQCASKHLENGSYLSGIQLQCQGKPLRFGFRLPYQELQWLLHYLNTQLSHRCNAIDAGRVSAAATAALEHKSDDQELTYRYSSDQASPNSTWRVVNSAEGPRRRGSLWLRQHGRWQFANLGRQLPPTLFWNAFVGTFFLAVFGVIGLTPPPVGLELVKVLIFLIPFAAISLFQLGSLVEMLVEPFRVTTWRIDSEQIECETRYWSYRRSEQWTATSVSRLMQRHHSDDRLGWLRQFDSWSRGLGYSIVFVNSDNQDVCTIGGMTEDETRSIARLIFDRTDLVQKR